MKSIKDLKIKKLDAVLKLTTDKLKEELKSAQKTLFTMRMKLALGELKQTHLIKFLKKYISQLKTVANNKS